MLVEVLLLKQQGQFVLLRDQQSQEVSLPTRRVPTSSAHNADSEGERQLRWCKELFGWTVAPRGEQESLDAGFGRVTYLLAEFDSDRPASLPSGVSIERAWPSQLDSVLTPGQIDVPSWLRDF